MLRLCEFVDSEIVSSPCEPVPFLDFVSDLPAPRQPRAETAPSHWPRPSGSRDAPAARATVAPEASEADATAAAATDEPARDPYEELDDVELADLRDWLVKKKEEMTSDRVVTEVHFEAACVGSQWAARNRGVGSYVVRATATNAAASRWAKATLGNEMASFL